MSQTTTRIPSMGKKKTKGDRKTPRTPVQFPVDWLRVARLQAAKRKQAVLWYLIDLIRSDAEADGVEDLPLPPWDSDAMSLVASRLRPRR